MADAQLETLVADVEAKEVELDTASQANDAAQTTAQAAMAAASATLQTKMTAHQALSDSIDALITYVQGLKSA